MASNFLTPPDFVKSILIIDATENQLSDVANHIQGGSVPYNIYLYNSNMNEQKWFIDVALKVDKILMDEDYNLPITIVGVTKFGLTQEFKNPMDFFTE